VFLAHYVGGGIDAVLDLDEDDFWDYLMAALDLLKSECMRPTRVVLSGIEKR